MTSVLFVCIHNSARSQMAEGLLRSMGGDAFDVHSAGTAAGRLHPMAVEVMSEIGIDISGHEAKSVERYAAEPFDWVITVCDEAQEACPVMPGARKQLHWSLPDPSAAQGSDWERLDAFREVRDRLTALVTDFLTGAAR